MTNPLKFIFLIMLFATCAKEKGPVDIQNPPGSTTPDASAYYPLKKGNWWVYDYYQINTNTGSETFWYHDSVWIAGDTIMNGHKYYHELGSNNEWGQTWWLFLRDSAGYMLTVGGEKILFSLTNYTDTFDIHNEGSFTIYQKMLHHDTLIPTPVGNFHSISKAYIWSYMGNPTPKNEYLFFARGIGMTQYCHWYYPNCISKIEGRLVKYYVQ